MADSMHVMTKMRSDCRNLYTLKGVVLEMNWKPRIEFSRQLRPASYTPHVNVISTAR